MSSIDVTKAFMDAVENGDIDAAAALLADDFVFSGPVPEPIGKEMFVGMTRINAVAFPDWKYNYDESTFAVNGDVVTASVAITASDISGKSR